MCMPRIGLILSINGDGLGKMAVAEHCGTTQAVSLACVPSAQIGDHVSIHAGFALAVLPASAAREQINLLDQVRKGSIGSQNRSLGARFRSDGP